MADSESAARDGDAGQEASEPASSDALEHSFEDWVAARVDDLSSRSKRILLVLDESGGVATTSEIAKALDLEQTRKVTYQLETYLEPDDDRHDLVDSMQPETEDGGTKAKVLHLLAEGESVVKYIHRFEESDDISYIEHLELLDSQVGGVRTRVSRLEEGAEERQETVAALQDSVDELEETLQETADRMIRLRNGYVAMKSYLEEEHGADLSAYVPDNTADRDREEDDVSAETAREPSEGAEDGRIGVSNGKSDTGGSRRKRRGRSRRSR